MSMPIPAIALPTIILALLLGACAAPQPPLPEQNWFQLEPHSPASTAGKPLFDGLLMIEEPRSDTLHAERALIYSDDPAHRRLNQYHYDYWADPPTRLLQSFLVRRLRAAAVAPQVMRYDINIHADAFISGRLQRLVQLNETGQTRVVVELELRMSYAGEHRPRLLRDYRAEVSVNGNGPEDSISGYEQAIDDIIDRFLRDLRSTVETAS